MKNWNLATMENNGIIKGGSTSHVRRLLRDDDDLIREWNKENERLNLNRKKQVKNKISILGEARSICLRGAIRKKNLNIWWQCPKRREGGQAESHLQILRKMWHKLVGGGWIIWTHFKNIFIYNWIPWIFYRNFPKLSHYCVKNNISYQLKAISWLANNPF